MPNNASSNLTTTTDGSASAYFSTTTIDAQSWHGLSICWEDCKNNPTGTRVFSTTTIDTQSWRGLSICWEDCENDPTATRVFSTTTIDAQSWRGLSICWEDCENDPTATRCCFEHQQKQRVLHRSIQITDCDCFPVNMHRKQEAKTRCKYYAKCRELHTWDFLPRPLNEMYVL